MGIEFTKAYVANGRTYATLKEAQAIELGLLFVSKDSAVGLSPEQAATAVLENTDKVIDILTTTDKSRPRARALNGGRKQRKPKLNSALPDYTEAQRADAMPPPYTEPHVKIH